MEQAVRYHNNGASQLLRTSTTEEGELFQQRLKYFRARPGFEPKAPEARIIPLDQRADKNARKDGNKIFLEGFLGQRTVGKVFLDVHRTNALSRVG